MIRTVSFVLGVTALLTLAVIPTAGAQEEPDVVPGLITAPNVDITADDGSLLADRLGVGDKIFIITHPKTKKKGWVRISRAAGDDAGIGWIESKNVQRYREYHEVSGGAGASGTTESQIAEQTVYSPPSKRHVKYTRIAVLPFFGSDPRDTFGQGLFSAFSSAIQTAGKFKVIGGVAAGGATIESPESIRKVIQANRLDGLFVGKVSSPVGANRFFQIKFLGKDRNTFVLEKTKRIPATGDAQKEMRELAGACAELLSGN
ncbi:MAG: hypothetical protein V1495_00970 [Pseudomonadota bacterium]